MPGENSSSLAHLSEASTPSSDMEQEKSNRKGEDGSPKSFLPEGCEGSCDWHPDLVAVHAETVGQELLQLWYPLDDPFDPPPQAYPVCDPVKPPPQEPEYPFDDPSDPPPQVWQLTVAYVPMTFGYGTPALFVPAILDDGAMSIFDHAQPQENTVETIKPASWKPRKANKDRYEGPVGLKIRKKGFACTRDALCGWHNAAASSEALKLILERQQWRAQEWEHTSCYMYVIPHGWQARPANACGQVIFLATEWRGKALIIMDLHRFCCLSYEQEQDTWKGCFIEAALFYGTRLQECEEDEEILCLAFAVQSQRFLGDILPQCDERHAQHFGDSQLSEMGFILKAAPIGSLKTRARALKN